MPIQTEGAPAPDSLEAKALAELEKEGHVIEGKQPNPDDASGKKEEPNKEEPPKEEPKKEEPKKEEPKPERTPMMVEAWKLKVVEDQKNKLSEQITELRSKVEEISKQKEPVSSSQKKEISNDIDAIIKKAEASGQDGEFLREFAKTIVDQAKSALPVDIEKKLASIEEERELTKQLNAYENEFINDVVPLVKEYNLSDSLVTELKSKLKDYAFSETYAKVPLKEIFRIKEGEFNFKTPKKSSEGKGVKVRENSYVDIENIDEESFKNLSPEQLEKFVQVKSSGGWTRPSSRGK